MNLSVRGDAAQLAVVLLGFQGPDEEIHHGLIGPTFESHESTAGRFLGWDENRYREAFKALCEAGELVLEEHEGSRGWRLIGWGRFECDIGQFGQRLYWRLRKRAKKAEQLANPE